MRARDGKAGLTCLVRGEWARILVACGALLGVLPGRLLGQALELLPGRFPCLSLGFLVEFLFGNLFGFPFGLRSGRLPEILLLRRVWSIHVWAEA